MTCSFDDSEFVRLITRKILGKVVLFQTVYRNRIQFLALCLLLLVKRKDQKLKFSIQITFQFLNGIPIVNQVVKHYIASLENESEKTVSVCLSIEKAHTLT